jgi:hypothetical protein
LAFVSLLMSASLGCGSDGHLGAGPGDDTTGMNPSLDGGPQPSCSTPNEGCACETPGEVVNCGQVDRRSGNYISCSLGQRTCVSGYWGPCVGDRKFPLETKPEYAGLKPLALGSASGCINNPCDPYCVNYVDNSVGLDAGPGLLVEGGLTLKQGVGVPGSSTCTGLQIVPNAQSITVTDLGPPFVSNPASLQFNAQLTPVGCSPGYTNATWALSNDDVAIIDGTGSFSVYSAVAVPVQVKAYAGSWSGTGTATVTVNINKTNQAPAGTAASFNGAGSGVDTLTVLYPYADTVFPRAVKAPVLQWDNAGTAAQAVKISLRYPSSGAATFTWSTIIAESAPPSATIPQNVWTALDQTAKGQEAIFAIQRLVGGSLKPEVTRKIRFSTAPLRGQIYYTEYGRSASSPLPSPAVGGSCSFALSNTYIRSLDPTGTSAPVNPFATIAPGGCPVCHSVSANGKMFVTSDRGWGAGGGVSRINNDGTFTQIADSPQPPKPGVDSRGFSFAALTPDGTYLLQGSNLWGNTNASGSAGSTGRLSGGNGEGLQGDYFSNATLTGSAIVTRVDPTINFDWAAGSPDPLLPVDNYSVRWTGKVQPYTSETYTFESETDDGVRVWVNNQLLIDKWMNQAPTKWSGSIALVAGTKYDIKIEYYASTGTATAKLRWSSPTTLSEIIPLTQLYPPPGVANLNGLTAVYYGGANFTGTQITRVDKTINFDWGNGSPDPVIPVDTYSVRWTGFVQPQYSQTFTFETETDDGVKLWVNNVLLVDKWVGQGPTKWSGTIALTAGTKYAIKIEYFEATGGAMARLRWSSPSTPYAIIPTTRLFP